MSGWPDEPDSPLQSSLLTGAGGAGGPPNRRNEPMLPVKSPCDWASRDCADTGAAEPSSAPVKSAAAIMRRYRVPPVMLVNPWIRQQWRDVPPAPLGDPMWLQYV